MRGPHGGFNQRRAPKPAESVPPPVVAEAEPVLERASSRRFALLRTGWFYRLRLAVLGLVLVLVTLWGARDWSERRARTTWQRPLRVAVVLVELEPVPAATLGLLTARSYELERRLEQEYARYTGRSGRPIEIVVRGTARASAAPPTLAGDGLLDLLVHGVRLWRWTRDCDREARVEWLSYDSRIYLALKPSDSLGAAFVEGESEEGGRVGVAQAQIGSDGVDFALFVTAHELLHTLGATDKYGAQGEAIFPQGYAQPERTPLFPQAGAEVMARNVPIAEGKERPPETLDELYVGETTAREIGWLSRANR